MPRTIIHKYDTITYISYSNQIDIHIIIVGYFNKFIDLEEAKSFFEKLIDEDVDSYSSEIVSDIFSNDERKAEEGYIKILKLNNYRDVVTQPHLQGIYTEEYNSITDPAILEALKYWRARELKKLLKINDNEELVEVYLRLSESFGFPKDLPNTTYPYTLFHDKKSIKPKEYLESIRIDAERIREFIENDL